VFHLFRLSAALNRTTPDTLFDFCAGNRWIKPELPRVLGHTGKCLDKLRAILADAGGEKPLKKAEAKPPKTTANCSRCKKLKPLDANGLCVDCATGTSAPAQGRRMRSGGSISTG
jgi:hypothetical protein